MAILFSGMFSFCMMFCFSKFDTVIIRLHFSRILGTTFLLYSQPIFWYIDLLFLSLGSKNMMSCRVSTSGMSQNNGAVLLVQCSMSR